MKSIDRKSPEFKSHHWVKTNGMYDDVRYQECLRCKAVIYASKKQNRNKWRVWKSPHARMTHIIPNCHQIIMDEALR